MRGRTSLFDEGPAGTKFQYTLPGSTGRKIVPTPAVMALIRRGGGGGGGRSSDTLLGVGRGVISIFSIKMIEMG